MRFSEANGSWQAIPPWAIYLVGYGFSWGTRCRRRRIGLISMPCDSAGAGLVALGAIRYRLTLAEANDALSHFGRIQALAGERAGRTRLRHESLRGSFRLDGTDQRGWVWARKEQTAVVDRFTGSGPPRVGIRAESAKEWRLQGEPPTEIVRGSTLPHRRFYDELIEGAAAPLESNLAASDSAVCFAGRISGESASRSALSAIRLECHGEMVDLAELLTVHRWSPDTVSRVTFFNTRTRQIDRSAGSTCTVIADGDSAFLRAIDAREFERSDVIGVIHRTIERERLDSIGTKLANLSQWYVPDARALEGVPPPRGITVSVLRRGRA